MASETKKEKKYPFMANCSGKDKPVKVELNTENPDGEVCIVCGGTPDGNTGTVCYPKLTRM